MVDASKSIEEVHTELKSLAKEVIDSTDKDIGQLWVLDGTPDQAPPAKKLCILEERGELSQTSALNGKMGGVES